MNYTTINASSVSCDTGPFSSKPILTRTFLELRSVFIIRIAVDAISCPLVVLLNILVMVAVKTKRPLRSKSNIALACLSTTDLVVGLFVQPLRMVYSSLMLKGETDIICSGLARTVMAITSRCVLASLYHFVLLGGERYLAIKHPFAYDNLVTEVRVIIASCLAWAAVIILPLEDFWPAKIQLVAKLLVHVIPFIFLPFIVYFNVSVYKEVRRNQKQIIANQVSLEVKQKLLKNKKAFYCTIIVLLTFFLCYFPSNIFVFIMISLPDGTPMNIGVILSHLTVTLFPILNSLFNPLIYAVRIRDFRVAFIQLLSRKTIEQAEELEMSMFGAKKIGAVLSPEDEVLRRENETLN